MRHTIALFGIALVASLALAACSKNDTSSTTTAAPTSDTTATTAPVKLPIPLSKLPSLAIKHGDPAAGAKAFAANCASCHGEGGKNGNVGPSLYGVGLKAGQVAYMIRNPAAIEKDSAMPKLPLSDKEVADIATYVESLK